MNNTTKIALITFFSSLYVYLHANFLYMEERGLNLFQANSIWAIILGTIFLAEVPTGIVADRIGRKYSVVAALTLQLLGEVLYFFARSYWMFVLIAVIAGIGFAFLSGCVEALIYETLPEEERDEAMKRAMGINTMAHHFAFVLAPIIGAYLVPTFTMDRFLLAVALTAASIAIGLLIAFTLKEVETATQQIPQSASRILKEGFGTIVASRLLLWLAVIGMLTSSSAGTLAGLYQPFFDQLSISSFWMGWGLSAGALLAGLSARYTYKVEQFLGIRWGFPVVCLLPGLLYLFLGVSHSALGAFLFFVLTYGSAALRDPLLSAYQNKLIESENRATILSMLNLLKSLYIALMALLMGWGADIDLGWTFVVVGVLIVAASILLRVDKVGKVVGLFESGRE
ncbi:MAG: MFS transporter [Chloroflexota bacterium]